MAITRKFRTAIMDRAVGAPVFRREMLTEAVNELLAGDLEAGKAMLRDYINGTITFQLLAKKLKKTDKSATTACWDRAAIRGWTTSWRSSGSCRRTSR